MAVPRRIVDRQRARTAKVRFTRREIQRNGPPETRNPAALEPALRHLEQRNRVRVIRQDGKIKGVEINPRLLEATAAE
jgi:hypothetical protein